MRDPIAYTYEADTHCPACAEERFGRCADGWIACGACGASDSESNEPGAVSPWDEWCEPSDPGRQVLACGTCHGIIEEHDHDGSDGTIGGSTIPEELAR